MPVGHPGGGRVGKRRSLNWRFIRRGFGLTLLLLIALALGARLLLDRLLLQIPDGSIPPPPSITAPKGSLPPAEVGLELWARYKNSPGRRAGSGFLLTLDDGTAVGVAAAHSVPTTQDGAALESLTFAGAGGSEPVMEFIRWHGEPGVPRLWGSDLTGDFVLLSPSGAPPAELLLQPDPRGGPQPGERVRLFSGIQTGPASPALWGTIISTAPEAAWALMDRTFDPGLMSGSPILSEHTGKVVGMALVAGVREAHLVIGMHPIGSLVTKAESAQGGSPIGEAED